jgi:hypothetical protein
MIIATHRQKSQETNPGRRGQAVTKKRTLALLLPSKGRFFDLCLTLLMTRVGSRGEFTCKIYLLANYNVIQRSILKLFFGRSAKIFNERDYDIKVTGIVSVYNFIYGKAREDNCEWVAIWSDDLLPEKRTWLARLWDVLEHEDFKFGIFSSNDGHGRGYFGWNMFGGIPCAHYWVARADALREDCLCPPSIKAYVGDAEICLDAVERGIPIDFIPVRLIHQPTVNATRSVFAGMAVADLETVYCLHPNFRGRLDPIVLHGQVDHPANRFAPDEGKLLRFGRDTEGVPWDEFVQRAYRTVPSMLVRLSGYLRSRIHKSPLLVASGH